MLAVITVICRSITVIDYEHSSYAIDMSGDIVFRWDGYNSGDEIIIVDTLKAMFGN
jgi:hypothetical protein